MANEDEGFAEYDKPLIIDCLKRIQKSMRLWTTDYGIRGYLEFVAQHIRVD